MASTYTKLQKGATGNNVAAMQTALKNQGYSVEVSGTFDDATEAALKQYQTNNQLTVDGIAGDETLGSLYNTNTPTPAGTYAPSHAVEEASRYLQSVQANAPAAYQSKYGDQLDSILGQIQGRAPFRYDVTADPLYAMYKDRYIMNGQRAMQDTMGQAAALTGGYGNSYAQSAGQQMYNQYMEGLNDVVPELEQTAYQRYKDEGDRLLQGYQLTAEAEDRAYNRYSDDYSRYLTREQMAQNAYDNAYARDYQRYGDDREWEYRQQTRQDALNSENRQYAMNLAMTALQKGGIPSEELLAMAGISPEDAQLIASFYKTKSSGSQKKTNDGDKDQQKQSAEEIQKNASSFAATLMTPTEFVRHVNKNGQYNGATTYDQYLTNATTNAYNKGKISRAELTYLSNYYANYVK